MFSGFRHQKCKQPATQRVAQGCLRRTPRRLRVAPGWSLESRPRSFFGRRTRPDACSPRHQRRLSRARRMVNTTSSYCVCKKFSRKCFNKRKLELFITHYRLQTKEGGDPNREFFMKNCEASISKGLQIFMKFMKQEIRYSPGIHHSRLGLNSS